MSDVMRRGRRLLSCLLLIALIFSLFQPVLVSAQTPEAPPAEEPAEGDAWLDEMMAQMSTADKVGQLFLVTFFGDDTSARSDIAHLVQVLRIGGVIVAPRNQNFSNDVTAPQQVLDLTTSLQTLAFTESAPITLTQRVPVTVTAPLAEEDTSSAATEAQTVTTFVTITQVITADPQGVPLFIATSQEGDGYPHTALRGGFTDLPSNMAIGATWDEDNAEDVGWLVGQELSAVGVNMLLGPSLDVLKNPRPGLSGDLGVRAFGGDPYWVGRMGQAYIRGVHVGSEGRVATVAKHLPGLGASDRSLEEEVATVDKSLQDLRLIELPPFFTVTQGEALTDTADALLTAHIRYRGFQGNVYYVTPPISLHAQGMQEIMAQPELVPWREQGGVLVSDSLGLPAIRRLYSPELTSFPHRQIALEAFQAGNDLLTLSRFSLNDSWDQQLRNIEDTVFFFRERYEADDSFRARVDQAVRRILRLKRRVCAEFSLGACTSGEDTLGQVGPREASRSTITRITQEAVTLLYPAAEELALRLPRPPRRDENIVIFTDAREARDCSDCPPFHLLNPQALRETILQKYGPNATGQVDPERIVAFTFAELRSFLLFRSPDLDPYIRDADWIVFAMLDYAPTETLSSTALKLFLRERADGLEGQNLLVLAYEAPYYLDTTEVSKLTAYYAIYSRSQPFIEASVRALFQDFGPTGKSPVTVEGVGYGLTRQLSPDPRQVIEVLRADEPPPESGTPQPVTLQVGDQLDVRSSVILDRNGNPVPDGTPVIFQYAYMGRELGGRAEAVTQGGVAEAIITLEIPEGELQITATSDPAFNSRPLVVRLTGETVEFLTPTPTSTPTPTPTPTPTLTPTPTPTSTPTPTPTPTPTAVPEEPPPPQPRVEWLDFALALLGMAGAGGIVLVAGRGARARNRGWNPAWRAVLYSGICGLVGYLFYGLAMPGSSFLEGIVPGLRGLLIGFVCGLLPLLAVPWLVRPRRKARG